MDRKCNNCKHKQHSTYNCEMPFNGIGWDCSKDYCSRWKVKEVEELNGYINKKRLLRFIYKNTDNGMNIGTRIISVSLLEEFLK